MNGVSSGLSRLRFRGFRAQITLLGAIATALLGAIVVSTVNLVCYLEAQDELLTSGLNRSERGLAQLNREVLRLSVMVNRADSETLETAAIQQQVDVLVSRLNIIRKHHISSDLSPELANRLTEFDTAWQGLQGDLTRWAADPENPRFQTSLYEQLAAFEQLINQVTSKHTNQRRDQYVLLVQLRSESIQTIGMVSVLFLVFTGLAVSSTYQFLQERQRVLTAIRSNEAKYRRIIETAEEGIWLLDPQGNTLFANHKMAAILGLTEAEMETANVWNFVSLEDNQKSVHAYFSNLCQGGRLLQDLQLIRQDGEVRWMLTNGTPVFDEEKQHVGNLCMLTDVTARKQSEEALRLAKQKAEIANQAKSDFLANVSHELRTPLNGILGYTQILKRTPTWGENERDSINIIHQCGTHLLTLINEILDLAKIEARTLELAPSGTYLTNVLQSVVETCRPRAERKGLVFRFHPYQRLPAAIVVDEKRLRQVLMNLLTNAIKFTERGSVSLTVEQLPAVPGEALPNTVGLRFAVTDTGIGIAQEQLSHIFQPFRQFGNQLKRAEGAGLGLSISRQIVALMDSQLQVESALGQGSTFWFEIWIPEAQEFAVHAYPQRMPCGYQGRVRRILVVDDCPTNRSIVIGLLESFNFEVLEAENGRQALALMAKAPPDAVIVDLMMPEMSGYELLRQIKNSDHFETLVTIASSASVFEPDQQAALDAGADAFLAKPIQSDRLLALLQQLLQLAWIYPATATMEEASYGGNRETLTPPDRKQLLTLLTLVQDGNVREVTAIAAQLKATDPTLAPFAEVVAGLVKGFQLKQLERFIVHHLQNPPTDSLDLASRLQTPELLPNRRDGNPRRGGGVMEQ